MIRTGFCFFSFVVAVAAILLVWIAIVTLLLIHVFLFSEFTNVLSLPNFLFRPFKVGRKKFKTHWPGASSSPLYKLALCFLLALGHKVIIITVIVSFLVFFFLTKAPGGCNLHGGFLYSDSEFQKVSPWFLCLCEHWQSTGAVVELLGR